MHSDLAARVLDPELAHALSLEQQRQMLLDAGVILASSSTNTGLLAREFICKGEQA